MSDETFSGDLIRLQQALAFGRPSGRMSQSSMALPPLAYNELDPIEQPVHVISVTAPVSHTSELLQPAVDQI
ncbi:MAG TPA: hypothetical protein VEX68_15130 [Bryobacteraceae bacterium]|nr:hypothetical protein [Bryobacteraceae bacterium]